MSVAVVTGGNRGIGLEVCRQLAAKGHEVILGSRDPANGERAAQEIGGVRAAQLDVADAASIARLAQAEDRVDIVVNNAAILYDTWARACEADLTQVQEALDTNLFGAWRMCLAFLPHLRRSGHGRIVNVSSGSGSLAEMGAGTPAYSVSKAALNALTRILAAEVRRDGILVNAVCPGWTATDMGGGGGRSVAEGAAGVVWAAELPGDGPTGGFFRDGRQISW
jgi:NAD(P)-dependent dehydrogenase (short-subunit alcohol dehydrogenase family)